MAKTAIGIFENREVAEGTIHDLQEIGLPSQEIHILAEPLGLTSPGAMSTAHTDFEVDLKRNLERIGASQPDVEGYLSAMRRGGVMVLATASDEKADDAVQSMNRSGALDVDELNRAEANLPSVPNVVGENPGRESGPRQLEISVPGRAR